MDCRFLIGLIIGCLIGRCLGLLILILWEDALQDVADNALNALVRFKEKLRWL